MCSSLDFTTQSLQIKHFTSLGFNFTICEMGLSALDPGYLKDAPGTSSNSCTWELGRNAESQALLRLTESKSSK